MSNGAEITGRDRTEASVTNEATISARIEEYLNTRKTYFQITYPGFEDVMLEGEAKLLREAQSRGDLTGWQSGDDPLQHISAVIEARFQQGDGSFQMSIDQVNFSPEIRKLLEESQTPNSNIKNVWMNDGGTITCPRNTNLHHEILSIGQGGCSQMVIATTDGQDTRISILHYGHTVKSKLLSDLEKRAIVHQNRKTDVILIVTAGVDTALIEVALRRLLPDARMRVAKCNLELLSNDPDRDVLRCQPQKNGTVCVSLKGLSGIMLGETEPSLL